MGEFDLIQQYFNRQQKASQDTALAIGDDCAVLNIPPEFQVAVTTDTLTIGTHFLPTISPYDLAYKSIAVNLSDLAAMGAIPRWVSLAITLPEVDEKWLAEFSEGLFAILNRYNVQLIGGDTTKGYLSITVTAQGLLPKNSGLYRHKAEVGDWIFVSGTLGDSRAGLELLLQNQDIKTNEQKNF